jgi:hypothetical protein
MHPMTMIIWLYTCLMPRCQPPAAFFLEHMSVATCNACECSHALQQPTCVALHVMYAVAGTYLLDIYAEWDGDVRVVREEVNVAPCPRGHVTGGRNATCNPCPRGLFSFTSVDSECTICPVHANCPGLDKVWPLHGWWHSAPHSTNIHR